MKNISQWLFLGLALTLAPACGGDDDDNSGQDASGNQDGSGMDAASVDDMNDGFNEAVDLGVGTAATGAIQKAGDKDYYKFEAAAGDWVWLFTEANTDNMPTKVDTVITLFDSEMTQIAQNDDAQPRVNPDSEIIFHVVTAGTYYVEIQEYSTFDADSTPVGQPSFTYALQRQTITEGNGLVIDTELGDTPGDAHAATLLTGTNSGAAYLLGTFNDATDVDYFSFTVPGTGAIFVDAFVLAGGADQQGSTIDVGVVAIDNLGSPGDPVLARIDYGAGPEELSPSLPGGTPLLISVAHPVGGTSGTNPFYTVKLDMFPDATAEADDTANNAMGGAQMLTLNAAGTGFVVTRLPVDGDVDHFGFAATQGQVIYVSCGSRRNGSGVEGLKVAVLNSAGATLPGTGTQAELLSADLVYDNLSVATTGTHYIKLTKTGQDATVSGDWVRCAVNVSNPT